MQSTAVARSSSPSRESLPRRSSPSKKQQQFYHYQQEWKSKGHHSEAEDRKWVVLGGVEGEHRGTDEEVAVKQVFLSKLIPRIKSSFHCELNFLSSVNHPNIVRLLDFFQYDGCAYLVWSSVLEGASLLISYPMGEFNNKLPEDSCSSLLNSRIAYTEPYSNHKLCPPLSKIQVDMVVVTDGSRILGLGDWSSWKWQSIGKLDLYLLFITEFAPWDDSVAVNDIVAGLKGFRDDDVKSFSSGLNSAETQEYVQVTQQGHVIAVPVWENHQAVLHSTAAQASISFCFVTWNL
ncbi:hypothetical protein Ahy_A10g049478 [Arachis hypogaea]|uniref:Malic enzyme N-terminal domain-containing protein n=1 Tax=Arachis hypogaea TaxID=3818 RepID=A0A445B790_ARAHY|nr:hypothetical protein Ahy_A10g049478 [Arachis hypogaea]